MESKIPSLVGSTGNRYSCSIAATETARNEKLRKERSEVEDKALNLIRSEDEEKAESNYFKSAQWSPDGTCLLTSLADNHLRTFILPTDLLEPHQVPNDLIEHSSLPTPEPIFSFTTYPGFNLSSLATTLILSCPRALPIRLSSPFHPSPILSSYSLICPTTEAYLTPSSITFTSAGTHFLTGTDSLISLFDLSRNGDGPVTRLPTIPSKRHKLKGGGVGMRGIVSALAIASGETSDSKGLLAAGTWTRWIGLYDAEGSGGTVANWTVEGTGDGAGVSQLHFSPCGRYLVVTERKSDQVMIYDIRVTGQLLASLKGRNAGSNQRLGVDVCPGNGAGFEVWAGGLDGVVRVWEDAGMREGDLDCDWEWKAHEDPVTSTIVHPSGTVVATCSGQRRTQDPAHHPMYTDSDSDTDSDTDESEEESNASTTSSVSSGPPVDILDNSLKVWSLV